MLDPILVEHDRTFFSLPHHLPYFSRTVKVPH